MLKTCAGILMLSALLLSGGCSTYHEDFVADLQTQGTHPFIVEPELRDLEEKIRTIAMADKEYGPPYHLVFDPSNEAIIGYFRDYFDKQTMMEMINLVRAGYDEAVAARYPHIGSETGCTLVDNGAYVVTKKVPREQFEWQFVQGECSGGLAHGIGEAVDKKLNAQFVGRFEQGAMVEGVFLLPLEDERKVIQLGEVPGHNGSARLLTSEITKGGYQWHRYGDFKDKHANGFFVNIWGYVDHMLIEAIGEVKNGKLDGFAAKQKLKSWSRGKTWNIWIGHYVDGTLNGPGAWTNRVTHLMVGYWKDGRLNGRVYGDYAISDDNNESFAGTYVNGERDGVFRVRRRAVLGGRFGDFTEIYSNGELIDDGIEDRPAPDLGKFIALGAGMTVIGTAGIPDTAKVEIAGAFAKDILAGGDGRNINALKQKNTAAGTGQTLPADDQGIFQLSCYDSGSFICIDYTLYSRAKSEQFRAQCSQGGNRVIASCDQTTRQAICSHQSAIGKTDTHDYLYGSEPEQVKQACLASGGQFRMVE